MWGQEGTPGGDLGRRPAESLSGVWAVGRPWVAGAREVAARGQ